MYIFRTITSKLRLLAYTVGLAALASCSQDTFEAPIVPVESNDGQISVLYEVEGDIPLTRGIAALEHEKSLEHVYILYFDHSDSDRFAGCTKAQASSGSSTIKFDPPEEIKENTQYRLLVVGNSDRYAGENLNSFSSIISAFTDNDDYVNVRGKLLAYSGTSVTEPESLPLCGRFVDPTTDDELYFNFTRTSEGIQFPYGEGKSIFRFQRAICRVDIHNLVANVLDIRYVRLVNTRDAGSYFFDGMNQGNYHELKFEADAKSPGFIALPEKSDDEKLQRLEAKLYCFPNTVNTCLPNDQKTTAAMIAGYYIDPETGVKDNEMTYYRFNISNAGEAQSLQRNYCYRATIKGVKRRGKTDELEAFNEMSPIFVYDIGEEWNTDDDNVVTDEHGNFLVVSKSLLTFSGDQSGADVVKLTVNTSEGMEWEIEMGDESTKYFQARKIEGQPGEKIQAFTCGPKQTNHSDYYYEGSLMIVAKNKNTGSVLRKEVRLVQLTTSGDVKCLIVNDYTSSFAQEVSKYGQTISYKVITGNPTNKWKATDVKGTMNGWSDRVNFTTEGTNGNYFTITFPSNIGIERSVDIEFSFDCGDPEANKEVKPITVTFRQEFCQSPLTIDGWPASGEMTLDCFDARPGLEYANCVVQSREFRVRLQKPEEHYFTVTSNFDKYRDLTLSEYDGRVGFNHEIYSIHPGLSYLSAESSNYTVEKDEPDESQYSNKLEMRTAQNNAFFINAFRMGPGDTTIEGTITVQVKDKDNNDVRDGKLVLTVRLQVPSDEYMINDVMIKNDIGAEFGNNENGWIYVMDRNIGCKPRNYTDYNSKKPDPNKAMWCFLEAPGKTDSWKITNMTNDQNWLGRLPLEFPEDVDNTTIFNNNLSKYIQSWKNEMKESYGHLGRMYENADDYPWKTFNISDLKALKKNMCVTKGRYFLISDDEVCPVITKEERKIKVKVCSWLPSGYNTVYGYSDSGVNFSDYIVLLSNKSILNERYFWFNAYGTWFYNNATKLPHLIRLVYLIGADLQHKAEYISKEKIDDELNYYKNHILQCFGTVKFE